MTNSKRPVGDGPGRAAGGQPAAPPGRQARKVIVASLVGTSLEWYDFFLYATASAVVFNRLFFPTFNPVVGTLLAFSTAGIGFVARPLGGIIFGHFGDRVGRKQVLVVTLILMGGATFLIGLLPTYAAIGIWAPLLLGLLRFLQGIGLGGEWGGAVLMTLEHGDPKRRGFNASWPQVGVPVGNLLAAAVLGLLNGVLSEQDFLSWGWRVGFLLSGALVLVGLWIRLTIAESPMFAEVVDHGERSSMPLVEVIKRHPRGILVSMGLRIGTDVAFYTFTSYILVYLTTNLRLNRGVGLTAVLVGSAIELALIPLFVLAAVIGLMTHAAMYGPQAAFVAELFSTKLRYSGSAAYQLAGVVSGAIAPIVSIALYQSFGTAYAVSGYVLAMLLITLLAIACASETAHADLRQEQKA